MENTMYTLKDGKIVETTTTVQEYDKIQILDKLNNQKSEIELGKEQYLTDVNTRIALIESQIAEITQLLNE